MKPDKEQNIDLTDEFLAYFQSKELGEEPCNPGAAWYTDWMNPATVADLPYLEEVCRAGREHLCQLRFSMPELGASLPEHRLRDAFLSWDFISYCRGGVPQG